jgi:hypothetical protein
MIEFGYSIYSQYGEDGIIQHLIKELMLSNKQCCEFGMSGTINSNTYNLVENYGWSGIFIEKNQKNISNIKKGVVLNKMIEVSGINSLDNILSETNIDREFDILSIDVDGNDYHIWNSLKQYEPTIVIIEFNPFINPTKDYIYNGSVFSSSFKSMIDLAKVKKYSLLCMSGNLVFGKNNRLIGTSLENFINKNPYDLFLDDAVMIGKKTFSFKRFIKKNII